MNTAPSLILLGFVALASSGLAAPDLSKLPPAASKPGVTYAKDIQPLFQASCFRCHGERQQKGDLRLDSLEAVHKGGEDGKVITPGDSAKSPLVIAVAQLDPKTAMPKKQGGGPGGKSGSGGGKGPPDGKSFSGGKGPGGPGGGPQSKPLTPEQVGLVRAWIDQGAK